MQSLSYAFILNMWIMGKVEEDFVRGQVRLNRITEDEAEMILVTPRNKQ